MSEHVTKKREEQLWEVQRIITQLKRKLKSFEKKADNPLKSMDDTVDGDTSIDLNVQKTRISDDESSIKTITGVSTSTNNTDTKNTPQETPQDDNTIQEEKQQESEKAQTSPIESDNPDRMTVDENGLLTLPKHHPDYLALIRLQLENQELNKWKQQLQNRINAERAEIVRMKKLLKPEVERSAKQVELEMTENEDERLMNQYLKENMLLEQKKIMLAKEIFEEKQSLIQMQIDLSLSKFVTRT